MVRARSRSLIAAAAALSGMLATGQALADDPFPCLSRSERQTLLAEYTRLTRAEGRARADAYAQAQGRAYAREHPGGVCATQDRPEPAREPSTPTSPQEPKILDRKGRPCRNIVMENRNVPNIGGSMGWAMFPVCAD